MSKQYVAAITTWLDRKAAKFRHGTKGSKTAPSPFLCVACERGRGAHIRQAPSRGILGCGVDGVCQDELNVPSARSFMAPTLGTKEEVGADPPILTANVHWCIYHLELNVNGANAVNSLVNLSSISWNKLTSSTGLSNFVQP